jgi:predicted glycosyltransferase
MKIWIDFINTPQVSFFIPFIKEFEKEQYQINIPVLKNDVLLFL